MNAKTQTAGKTAITNGACAPLTTNALTKGQIATIRRRYAEFIDRREKLAMLKEAYPAAFLAIDEYAGAYYNEIGESKGKRALRQSVLINNDLACVSGASFKRYAAKALAAVSVRGDLPGDAVPAEVVQGLQYLRHNLPQVFGKLVKVDAALGPVLPATGEYAAPALLMRSALAAA